MEQLSGGVRWVAEVHPQVLFCRNGAVVQVTRGSGKLREVYSSDRHCQVQLNGRGLYVTNTNHCPSYRDLIKLGYGQGVNEELQTSAGLINGRYSKLRHAVEGIHLMLNLLEQGTYFIGDFDLFPVQKYDEKRCCFWNLPKRNAGEGYWPYTERSEWAGGTYPLNDQPLYLVPTKRARSMDSECVEHYIRLLNEDPDHIPRAIGLYLRGSGVLLIDGHHKALAAASAGVPVKTLVICRLENEGAVLSAASEKKRLFLRNQCMRVCDNEETFQSSFFWMAEKQTKSTSPIITGEPDEESWGNIDERWIAEMKQPHLMNTDRLRDGLKLPYHTIRELITRLQKLTPDELHQHENSMAVTMLRDYLLLCPESKWITQAQRQWLSDLREKYCI